MRFTFPMCACAHPKERGVGLCLMATPVLAHTFVFCMYVKLGVHAMRTMSYCMTTHALLFCDSGDVRSRLASSSQNSTPRSPPLAPLPSPQLSMRVRAPALTCARAHTHTHCVCAGVHGVHCQRHCAAVGAQALLPPLRPPAPRVRRAAGGLLVPGALPAKLPSQGAAASAAHAFCCCSALPQGWAHAA